MSSTTSSINMNAPQTPPHAAPPHSPTPTNLSPPHFLLPSSAHNLNHLPPTSPVSDVTAEQYPHDHDHDHGHGHEHTVDMPATPPVGQAQALLLHAPQAPARAVLHTDNIEQPSTHYGIIQAQHRITVRIQSNHDTDVHIHVERQHNVSVHIHVTQQSASDSSRSVNMNERFLQDWMGVVVGACFAWVMIGIMTTQLQTKRTVREEWSECFQVWV